MNQHHRDRRREKDPLTLPDIETFQVDDRGYHEGRPFVLPHEPGEEAFGLAEAGWYYWYCLPGHLPDTEPIGPFFSEGEALNDAREGFEED